MCGLMVMYYVMKCYYCFAKRYPIRSYKFLILFHNRLIHRSIAWKINVRLPMVLNFELKYYEYIIYVYNIININSAT